MTEERLPSKFAFILHADVVGSTTLVRQDEQVAHTRIQDAFRRLSQTIASYGGTAHEVRGDALVAEFERASDAVAAAIAFQIANTEHNKELTDSIQPELRVGVGMGEGVIAEDTMTGMGVVLAQRLEQLAESGGIVIQGAVYEAVPKRMPFTYQSLGEREVKGFDEPVRAYAVNLEPGKEVPLPEPSVAPVAQSGVNWKGFAIGAVALFFVSVGVGWFSGWLPATISPSPEKPDRLEYKEINPQLIKAHGLQTVKAGRLNLKLTILNRWDAQVVEADKGGFSDSEMGHRPAIQTIILTDKEGEAHVKISKWFHPEALDNEPLHRWMQDQGIPRFLFEHLEGKNYRETGRSIVKGNIGSGEEMTVISLTLQVDNETRHVRIAYVIRAPKPADRSIYVFFFHNERDSQQISDDDVVMITGSAAKMF